MYLISKKFDFDASHQLEGLPYDHKCGRLHGHTYTVEIVICSNELTEEGWVVDFGELYPIKEYIDTKFDHRHLNNVVKQPTSENLAKHFYEQANHLLQHALHQSEAFIDYVRVSETPKTYAEYRG